MRRRRWWAAAGLAVAAAVSSAGCGVPAESTVVVAGPPAVGRQPAGDEDLSKPPVQNETDDPEKLVHNFLAAAAGTQNGAVNRARAFLPKEAQEAWKPQTPTKIVRVVYLTRTPAVNQPGTDMKLVVRQVGELLRNGSVRPTTSRLATYHFRVANVTKQTGETRQAGLFIFGAPKDLMLSDTALNEYFEPRTLYFWSQDDRTLVPDLRYLPRDVLVSERSTQVVKWLLDGPSEWLAPAVKKVEAQLIGNVSDDTRSVQVRLSRAAGAERAPELNPLATQLRWSLRRDQDRVLDLSVDQESGVYPYQDYLGANPAWRAGTAPVQLCVYERQVRPLNTVRDPRNVPPGAAAPRLPDGSNSAVLRAAMHRERDTGQAFAALVRAGAGGRENLYAGAGLSGVIRSMDHVSLNSGQLSQPAWLPRWEGIGLIAAGGVLYRFSTTGAAPQQVTGVPRGITAFAVPPDGRRLAYIHGGRLYVAALTSEGSTVGVDPGRVVEVPTGLTGLTGVGWSQQTTVVVAGQAGGATVIKDVTVDGALVETRLAKGLGEALVTHLVAFTDDPADNAGQGQVMFVANNRAYNLFSAEDPLDREDVEGAAPAPTATSGGKDEPSVSAPFFLD